MSWPTLRRLNVATHRDLGYFFSSLVIAYCVSGLALNHADDWNPDFVIIRRAVALDRPYSAEELTPEVVQRFGRLVGEDRYKVYDQPTPTQLKVYFSDASLHVHLDTGQAEYERVTRRPVVFQTNVLHRNSLKGWRWAADVFAVMLIVLTLTGLFILRGRQGLSGRGKWLLLAGALPPVAALILFELQ
jgi:hypothetical protein